MLAGVQCYQKLHGRVVVEQEVMASICPWGWMIVLMNSMVEGVEVDWRLFQVVEAEAVLKL